MSSPVLASTSTTEIGFPSPELKSFLPGRISLLGIGTAVAVTATPAAGYTFSSWSGACTGTGACSVTMNANKTVTANFTALTGYTLYLPMLSKN